MYPIERERIDGIRDAAAICRVALDAARARCHAGVRTAQIDDVVRRVLAQAGAASLMRLAPRADGLLASCTVCVNDEVVEVVPGERVLCAGDLVTVDLPARFDGFAADIARSWVVPNQRAGDESDRDIDGDVVRARHELLDATNRVIEAALSEIAPRVRWAHVAACAERRAGNLGFSLIRGFAGHAIGRDMHEPPAAPIPAPRRWRMASPPLGSNGIGDFSLLPGLVLTIEPILTRGDPAVSDLGALGSLGIDHSTGERPRGSGELQATTGVRTRSGQDACTVERMVLVTDTGAEIIDSWD